MLGLFYNQELEELSQQTSMGYTTTTDKMVVYRMYTFPHVDKIGDKLGSWWSLVKPTGTKANYKAANAICFNWNN